MKLTDEQPLSKWEAIKYIECTMRHQCVVEHIK